METFNISQFTGLTEGYASSQGSSLDTGDLRRRYNFGAKISELNVARDPFFRLLAKLRRDPTDDPEFKFVEQRPSWHKRYAYVTAHGTTSAVSTTSDATVTATNIEQGDTYYVQLKTDYKSAGNISNVYGNEGSKISIGATGTRPQFLFPGLEVKIPFGSAFNVPNDYIIGRIEEVTNGTSEDVICKLKIIRTLKTATNNELQWLSATAPMSDTYNVAHANIAANLESKKTYVSGNAHAMGSGYPESWKDNPYSTGFGKTQIFKTAMGMDNTTRATVFKYAPNEWARIWGSKMLDHKWDIENTAWWSVQYTDDEGIQYTQGAIDYIINYGQTYTLAHSTKTADDFQDDLSQLIDPRITTGNSHIFFADTYTYNWLNKLSGFYLNNIQISPNFKGDFSFAGRGQVLGVAVNRIATNYGDIMVARDVHLDGSGVSLVAVNMNAVKWRPLIGNGLNRDTAVYVGVQTLENTGVDKRVDLILTEGGFEWSLPETHAIWTAA